MANARIQLPDETWTRVKVEAASRNATASRIVEDALNRYLDEGKQWTAPAAPAVVYREAKPEVRAATRSVPTSGMSLFTPAPKPGKS